MVSTLFNLSGKTALVTGGNGGIGFGIAKGLADAGASIVIAARNQEKTKESVAALKNTGTEAKGLYVDVSSEDSIKDMVLSLIHI